MRSYAMKRLTYLLWGKGLTVASQDQELILVSELVLLNIRECRDDLLLGGQLGTFFELKISNGARQG